MQKISILTYAFFIISLLFSQANVAFADSDIISDKSTLLTVSSDNTPPCNMQDHSGDSTNMLMSSDDCCNNHSVAADCCLGQCACEPLTVSSYLPVSYRYLTATASGITSFEAKQPALVATHIVPPQRPPKQALV